MLFGSRYHEEHRAERQERADAVARGPRIAAQRIAAALGGLHQTYTTEGVGVWLFGRKRSLDERSPIQILADGDIDGFVSAVERLGDWEEPNRLAKSEERP